MTVELATEARPRRLAAALRREGVRVLLAALGAQTAISFAEQGIPSLSILIKHDLGLSAAASGGLISALGIGRIAAFYPAGRAVDRYGEIRLLLVASVGTGI